MRISEIHRRQPKETTITPEKPKKSPQRITFVLPALNEAANLPGLKATIEAQPIPENMQLRVVLSDNGSDEATKQQERDLIIHGEQVYFVDTSTPKHIGSALHVGMEEASKRYREDNPDASAHDHIIVRFDADTRSPPDSNMLQTISDIFSDQDIMVAHGPAALISTQGKVTGGPPNIEATFKQYLSKRTMRVLYRRNGRDIQDFLNPPQDLFFGGFSVFRESAYQDYTSGFQHTDRVGEDMRLSSELQRRLPPEKVAYDKALRIFFSGREYEIDGKISGWKLFKSIVHAHQIGDHVASQLAQGPDDAQTVAQTSTAVIGDFIRGVEKELYTLADNQQVKEVTKLSRRKVKNRKEKGDDVRPAINAATGETIPKKYAVVEVFDTTNK
jgi:glycosyltransferase involved in cell wall biosynthesis